MSTWLYFSPSKLYTTQKLASILYNFNHRYSPTYVIQTVFSAPWTLRLQYQQPQPPEHACKTASLVQIYSGAGRSRMFFSCSPPSFVRVWNDNVSPHHRPVYLLVLLVAECVKLSKQRYTVFWLVWLGLIKSWMPILYTDFLRLTNCLSLTVNLIQQAMRDDLCSPIYMEFNCWTIIAAFIAGSMCWCTLKVLKERKYMVMIRLVLAWCIFYFIFIVY